MATVTKPVALDESLNTTDSTPKNIADVLKDKLGDIASAISGGGGGSGGHTIQNASGANMPQETTMQFKDSHVTDNSQAGKTEVEVIKSVASADYSSETEDGLYLIPDGDGSVIEPASDDYVEVTADGVKTWETLLNELRAEIDLTKVTIYSVLTYNGDIYSALYIDNNTLAFSSSGNVSSVSGGVPATVEMLIRSSSSQCFVISGTTATDVSSNKPTNGTKITLYYGNKKAVVDLQTTANRCLMSNGETVQDAISDYKVLWTGDSHTTGDTINLNDSINNYKKIMFVFNVIPNRTPDFDVPADQMWYPSIQTYTTWDISSYSSGIKNFTVEKRTNGTSFYVALYAKIDSSTQYNPGLVKIIGFKTN